MLREIRLVLDRPDLDYDSFIILDQMPSETAWFRGRVVPINCFQETDSHCGHGKGCFTVTDIETYSGSIIKHAERLKKIGYKIVKL